MALDLTGIQNVEFYSGHYLEAVLEGDLKAVFQRWAEAEADGTLQRAPHKALAALATRYLNARAEAEGVKSSIERWSIARGFHAHLIEALGYPYKPSAEPLEGDEVVPVVVALRRDGRPFLWILDSCFPLHEDDDPLVDIPHREQLPKDSKSADLPNETWRTLLDERILRIENPPRWILFLSGNEALLTERHKWSQGKYLRFQIGEILGRKESKALRAVAGLLHRDVLAPEAGVCLHDTLDENSHKHAFAVSADLKHGVRRSVELLANEAVWYRREKQKLGVFKEKELAESLTAESLTWLYRLLFLFFVEARGAELGVVPMGSDIYRDGYSLEALRDLELVPLTTAQAREGYFIHDSLKKLFSIVNGGFPSEDRYRVLPYDDVYQHAMRIDAVNSPLFDDDRLEILKNVRIRNLVLQEILQLLSLSAEKKKKARGRISYAQLGINQLGAVYEGLLSYTGFFATEDLYEVASEKDCKQLSGKSAAEREALKTYFVPASRIGDYKEDEIVKDANGRKVVHPRGDFIFRLAGRNREKSASYYTPEVLTKCLVKYALKELLWEEDEEGEKLRRKKTADEILTLSICEPAMGSSAFLIETVDQLADAYLEARQEERAEAIPPEDYQREKRRVKARLATNNCYGVDLNPTAVELAKVSLWLATLYEEGKCPWFGLRLATGNSLVGARREVFKTADVTRKGTKDNPNWLGLVPEPISLYHGEASPRLDEHWIPPPRPKGTIYHFLLPAEGMAAFDKDKVIKQLAPEAVKRIKEWRKEFCRPFSKKDAERLEQISDAVDRLFAQVVRERVLATQETSDRVPVWGEPPSDQQVDLLVRDQEEVAASFQDGSSAYRRLKLAMDAWCALWFWPVEEANLLPDRATWLAQLELVLKGQVTYEPTFVQGDLFAALTRASEYEATSQSVSRDVVPPHEVSAERLKRLKTLSDAFRERRADYFDECGLVDIEVVLEGDASLRCAHRTANRLHYHHWPLRFAEIFAEKGGFDLILGNPPWVKLEWDESQVLSDFDPSISIRRTSVAEVNRRRTDILQDHGTQSTYSEEYESLAGLQEFLTSSGNYTLLRGQQANLYKCFITQGWSGINEGGSCSFLHSNGVFEDPKGGPLRRELYPRLVNHFQFINELRLFPEVHNLTRYSLNLYRRPRDIRFLGLFGLLHPRTVEDTFRHDGMGPVPAAKNQDGSWDLRGHLGRLVLVDRERLELFGRLYESPEAPPVEARLPVLQSAEVLKVLHRLSGVPRLGPAGERWATTREWHEGDRQKDGTIRRETAWPQSLEELIVSGPHIYVANPLFKNPNDGCKNNRDYKAVDLGNVSADFIPRTTYVRSCEEQEYWLRAPSWKGQHLFRRYRYVNRKMVAPTGERTLVPAILPPGAPTTGGVLSVAFASEVEMIRFAASCSSIVVDFFVKTTGRSDLYPSQLERLPLFESDDARLSRRCLRLNCVTQPYSELWEAHVDGDVATDAFVTADARLRLWSSLGTTWSPASALRSDLERRQALVEIDVLVAMKMNLTLNELLSVYAAYFGVLDQYERHRLYDQNGRIIPSSSTSGGESAVNVLSLGNLLSEQAGFDIHAKYHPDGSNTQELRKQKTRLGKKEADVLGVPERCTMADLLAETEVRWSDEDYPEGRPVRLVGLRYTDPGLEPRMERVYPTPWTRCDREADYRQAWAEFERRLGKKMPEGTPL